MYTVVEQQLDELRVKLQEKVRWEVFVDNVKEGKWATGVSSQFLNMAKGKQGNQVLCPHGIPTHVNYIVILLIREEDYAAGLCLATYDHAAQHWLAFITYLAVQPLMITG
jgi:hypothetical protein